MVRSTSKIEFKFKERKCKEDRFQDEHEQMKWKVQSEGKLAKNSLTVKRHRFGQAFVDRTPSPDFHCRTDASRAASAV